MASLAELPLSVTAWPWVELPCGTVSCRPWRAKHAGSISGLEVAALGSVLSRLLMQRTTLLEEQGHTNIKTFEEGVMSPQQSTKRSQHTSKGERHVSNPQQEPGRSGRMGRVCRVSILVVKQNTLLVPPPGGDGSRFVVCSVPVQMVSLIAPPWMKTTGFAKTFDRTN